MTRTIDTAECAKLVRKALKANFPDIKFSVRTERYSMGSHVDVFWTDGPTTAEVDALVGKYSGADFDGMDDSWNFHDSVLNGESVHYAAHGISTSRKMSEEAKQNIITKIEQLTGEPYGEYKSYDLSVNGHTYSGYDGIGYTMLWQMFNDGLHLSEIEQGQMEAAEAVQEAVAILEEPQTVEEPDVIEAVSITLERAEGYSDQCVKITIEQSHGVGDVWAMADAILKVWGQTAPELGYDKCDFTVTYRDGEIYSGRYDLQRHDAQDASLSAHMCAFIGWHSDPDNIAKLGFHQGKEAELASQWQGFATRYAMGVAQ